MSRNLILLILCFFQFIVLGQTDKEKVQNLFIKSQNYYENLNQFKITSNYSLYTTYESKTKIESYPGIIVKNNSEYYYKIQNTEFVSLKTVTLKIDNETKRMLLSPETKKSENNPTSSLINMIDKFNVFSIQENGSLIICTLKTPRISFVPYSKIVITFNKADFSVVKQVFYLLNKSPYKDKNGKVQYDYPRLEIDFSNYQKSIAGFEIKFIKDYYIQNKAGKIIPSKNYSLYQIID